MPVRIGADDLVRLCLAALDDPEWTGPVNATTPEPVTNHEFASSSAACCTVPRCCRFRRSRCMRADRRCASVRPVPTEVVLNGRNRRPADSTTRP